MDGRNQLILLKHFDVTLVEFKFYLFMVVYSDFGLKMTLRCLIGRLAL